MRVRGVTGLCLLSTLAAGISGCQKSYSDKDIKESVLVSLADVRHLMNESEAGEEHALVLIDPRAPKYYAEGHIPGRNLRLPQVPELSPPDQELRRYSRLVVYGDNPGSAVAKAMFKRLLAVGYSGVRFYPGGVEDWQSAGYEVETSEPPAEEPGGEVLSGS